MSDGLLRDAMFDTYIYETSQQLEKLETIIMQHEESKPYVKDEIDEIFRIMHTIKGASGMMGYQHISNMAHSVEDLFCLLRNREDLVLDYVKITDLVLVGLDYIKEEIENICQGEEYRETDNTKLIEQIRNYMAILEAKSSQYVATLFFEECCNMEDLRAYEVVSHLPEFIPTFSFEPDITVSQDGNADYIRTNGFKLKLETEKEHEEVKRYLENLLFVERIQLEHLEEALQVVEEEKNVKQEIRQEAEEAVQLEPVDTKPIKKSDATQSFTSISFDKLDKIMNLLGEMVVAEAMVLENPDLVGLNLVHFQKAARQLSKITEELQDEIISMRLVPVGTVFQKMQRVVREMNKKLDKKVQLHLIGEETEIDKKVVDFITDPIMHMVRNAIDHGIEGAEERINVSKKPQGNLTLEAKNDGGDVFIKIIDDGRGLDKEGILKKAIEKGLVTKQSTHMSDEEIYSLIFKPGFSTKDSASEFSGRGVGMDVVTKNIEAIGGNIHIESMPGEGTTFTIKIPLTMAIIDGMTLRVGKQYYTIPTRLIKESFRPTNPEMVIRPNKAEMIILRGECIPIIKLYERYDIETNIHSFEEGIVVRLEQNGRSVCLFVDEIIGQQQVVIKTLPRYILNMKKVRGISGCTLLGDGTISLILEFEGLIG